MEVLQENEHEWVPFLYIAFARDIHQDVSLFVTEGR